MMGRGLCRRLPAGRDRAVTDKEGVSVGEALEQIGYIGEQTPGTIPSAPILRRTLSRGRFSKMKRKPSVSCRACWGSAGTTAWSPAGLARRTHADAPASGCPAGGDPHYAGSGGHCRAQRRGRGTVGSVQVWPNSRNVVPGEVTFSIDMRNLSDALVDEMDRQLRAFIAEVERESGLQVALKQVSHYPAAPFDAECQQAIADAAQRLGYPARPIVSGAGHDAVYMSYLAPTGMIFIPCKDGISHNEIEYASPEHVAAGANVLLQVMLQYARPV